MTVDHQKLRSLFIQACDLPVQQQREFIEVNCDGQPELQAELEKLLRSDGSTDGLLADEHLANGIRTPFDLVGHTIDKYKVLEEIGEGGFGIVYMAQQIQPVKRKVALKVIKPGMDTRDALARFEAERQALALMEHPNICRVLDAGSTSTGHPYFVMELVKGIPITDYCSNQNVALKPRLKLFQTICQAIQHAHAKGIIHRDLKPSNVMITFHDTVPVPKIIDFGISKALNQQLTEKTLFTRYGQMLGTPMYMSPEQAEHSGLDIDIRSDVYSLGVLLYELLTGTQPLSAEKFQSATYADMIRIITQEDPPTPSTRLSWLGKSNRIATGNFDIDYARFSQQVQGDLDRIVMKALEKDRTRRYDTVNDFARDIERYLNDEPVTAGSPTMLYRLNKFAARNRALVISTAAVLAALLIGFIVSLIGFIQANSANELAASALLDEQTHRTRAERQETRALAALDRERQQRKRVEASLYFQRISQAQREKSSSNLRIAQKILDDCPEELRGWEWEYLKRVSQTNVRTFTGMSMSGIALAISPNGKFIAAGCARWLDADCVGELMIWDSSTGKQVCRLPPQRGGTFHLEFSPDGERLATANGNGGGLSVWDVRTGTKLATWGNSSLYGVHYCPTKPLMACVGTNRAVHLVDSEKLNTVASLRGHTSPIFGVAFSPDGKLLATTAHNGEMFVWDVDSGAIEARFENSGNRYARFSPDGKLLITCGYGLRNTHGGIFVYRIGQTIKKIAEHRTNFGHVTRIEFSPDSQYIVLNGFGGKIRIWEPVSGFETRAFVAHQQNLNHVCFSPDGRHLVSSGSDKLIKYWDLTLSPTPVVRAPQGAFARSFAYHPLNGNVAIGGGYNTSAPRLGEQSVTVVTMNERYQPITIARCLGANQWINAVEYHPDGTLLAAAGSEGRVCIWDSPHNKRRDETPAILTPKLDVAAHQGAVTAMAFVTGGGKLISGGLDGKISIIATESGNIERRFAIHDGHINSIAVHPQANIVLSAGSDQTLKVSSLADGSLIHQLQEHHAEVMQTRFSPDGNYCATGDAVGKIVLWQTKHSEEPIELVPLQKFDAHDDRITGLSFSPDQNRLASISLDGNVAVWDVKTFQEAIRLEPSGENRNLFSVRFSPDGKKLGGARAELITFWNAAFDNTTEAASSVSNESLILWHQQQMANCRKSNNWYGVIDHASHLIELQPSDAWHYAVRGVAHANHDQWAAAVADFSRSHHVGNRNPLFLLHFELLKRLQSWTRHHAIKR